MGLTQLASLLRQRGLATASQGPDSPLTVRNPVSRPLQEEITCRMGRYLTGFGYEIGQVGDERQAADRLAFLLCVPSGEHPASAPAVPHVPHDRGVGRFAGGSVSTQTGAAPPHTLGAALGPGPLGHFSACLDRGRVWQGPQVDVSVRFRVRARFTAEHGPFIGLVGVTGGGAR